MPAGHWSAEHAAGWLRLPRPDDTKYRRGVLGLRTGSAAYPGAAVLGAAAAWRTGIGMLRYVPPLGDPPSSLGLPTPAAAVLAAHPETVFGESDSAARPCDAWVLGSGTDPAARSFAEEAALDRLLGGDTPLAVDAGALDRTAGAAEANRLLAPAILTPHRGEFDRLWTGLDLGAPPESAAAAARALAARLGATVLLKGSVTHVATPGGRLYAVGPATPWLATAGTGDVLAGALGALLAQHAAEVRRDPEALGPLGATAALLHDTAARIAGGDPAAPITALDVARALPRAVVAIITAARG